MLGKYPYIISVEDLDNLLYALSEEAKNEEQAEKENKGKEHKQDNVEAALGDEDQFLSFLAQILNEDAEFNKEAKEEEVKPTVKEKEKKDLQEEDRQKYPIHLNGEPLKIRKAPKFETKVSEKAPEEKKEEVKQAPIKEVEKEKEVSEKNIYEATPEILSNLDVNKNSKFLFYSSIDEKGEKCYYAHPFGPSIRNPWDESIESIHVNDDTLVIKSRIYLKSDIPDFKESLVRAIRVKLPADADYETVTAEMSELIGLTIKVLKKPYKKKGSYLVNIDK